MLLEFLAIMVAGFAGAGIALAARYFLRALMPDWIVPGGVALGMLSMVIWLEYTWASRFEAGLPEGMTVVARNEQQSWFRPWTYVVPLTTRVISVDNRISQRSVNNPDLVLTGLVLSERWAQNFGFKSLFDCANARRADLTEGTKLDEEGIPLAAEWYPLAPDDQFLTVACGGGAHGGSGPQS